MVEGQGQALPGGWTMKGGRPSQLHRARGWRHGVPPSKRLGKAEPHKGRQSNGQRLRAHDAGEPQERLPVFTLNYSRLWHTIAISLYVPGHNPFLPQSRCLKAGPRESSTQEVDQHVRNGLTANKKVF